jgi:hypothetical protein
MSEDVAVGVVDAAHTNRRCGAGKSLPALDWVR